MTFNDNYIEPTLADSQYTEGMQWKKLERQAVKGLTPKYCYATITADQTVPLGSANIWLNKYITNDNRMNTTNGRIIIPQSWLRMLTLTLYHWLSVEGDFMIDILKNGGTNVGTTATPFYVRDRRTIPNTSSLNVTYFISIPLYLEQNDYITVSVFNWFTSWTCTLRKDYTQLRLQSYILY